MGSPDFSRGVFDLYSSELLNFVLVPNSYLTSFIPEIQRMVSVSLCELQAKKRHILPFYSLKNAGVFLFF